MDAALQKAGCRAGDEVRILGYAFDFEGAEELEDEDDVFDPNDMYECVEADDVDDSVDATFSEGAGA